MKKLTIIVIAVAVLVILTLLLFPLRERHVNKFDQSARNLDAKPTVCLAADNKQLVIGVRVGWRVTDASAIAKSFPGDSITIAQHQLESMVYSAEAEVIGLHNLSDFVNPDGSEVRLDKIEKEIESAIETELDKKNSGIKIESLGISSVKQR
jgi:regulator of protease activity HflC (stomatin/prohibitin superfamily)